MGLGFWQRAPAFSEQVRMLVGPWLTTSQMSGLGGSFATWDSAFAAAATTHWNDDGVEVYGMSGGSPGSNQGSDGGNYYDRVKVWYLMWARTGTGTYLTRARAQAAEFVNNYINNNEYGNNYASSTNFTVPEGVVLYYYDMIGSGNASEAANALTALGYLTSIWNDGYSLAELPNLDPREAAYPLRALYWGNKLNAPSLAWTSIPNGFTQGSNNYHQHTNWADRLQAFVDASLANWGAGRWDDDTGACKPFMNSLLRDSYILMYEKNNAITPATRAALFAAIKASADYEWTNLWNVPAQAFTYSTGEGGQDTVPYADLNLMIAPAFAWIAKYYAERGDTANAGAYATKHDTIFAGGVTGNDLSGSKQFNQQYTTSFRGPAWAQGITRA